MLIINPTLQETTDSKRCKHFMECDEILSIHIFYVMHRWKGRSSHSLKTHYHQYQVSQLIHIPPVLLCNIHYKNTSCTDALPRHAFCQWILKQLAEDHLQKGF
jgi:hypothetical protein